ncbi:asparagine synthase-related protein [Niallia circulans]
MDATGWFSELNAFEQRRRHFDDLFHWNASNTFMTKLSLKYGLISRDPTNDIRVIRFCLSIPEDQYVQKGMDRALIRRSTEGYLPDEIRLNQQIRGAQGTDWLYRVIPHWKSLLQEAREVSKDPVILSYINYNCLKRGLDKLGKGAISEYAVDPDVRALFRSIIVYRFLKKLKLAG